MLVHVYDEAEINLPETVDGAVKFIDSETNEEISFTVGSNFIKEYAAEYAKHLAELESYNFV